MPTLFIVNPCAGKKQIVKKMPAIEAAFKEAGHRLNIQYTKEPGDAGRLARRLAGRYALVVCCGGDGTLSETVGGLMTLEPERRPPLGYIPAGTTNDFAASLGLARDPLKAAAAILEGRPRPVDVGRFDDQHFVYIASFGAFTKTSYTTPQHLKNTFGHFAYVLESVKELASLTVHPIRLEAGEAAVEGDFILGSISNTTSIGGMIKLKSSGVAFDDGLFEILLIRDPKNPVGLSKVLHSLNTGDFDEEYITFLHAADMTIHCERPIPWSLDGEFRQGGEAVRIQTVPRALRMMLA